MVAQVTLLSQKQSYGRRMVLAVLALAIYLALVAGAAGDALMLVASFGGLGTGVGAGLSLLAERRLQRKPASPWNPHPPVRIDRYMRLGYLYGACVGLVVAILDLWIAG